MSYNIDTFRLKELSNFKFPVSALYKNPREDWHPDRADNINGSVTFENMDTEITGTIENNIFHMTEISCSGEGSGTVMHDMLEPAFKESTGKLIASCVWEGGDTVNRLEVDNGYVKWINIDL